MEYEQFCSFDNLYAAYRKARLGKRGKKAEASFEYHAIERLLILSKELRDETFEPGALSTFHIYEPKERLIQAPTFKDKIVQHTMTDSVIYDTLSKSFIRDNVAAQYGKGTHDGLYRLEAHMRDYFLKRKGRDEAARKAAGLPYRPAEEWDYADGWVLKGDVRHFFASIDHEKLKARLATRFDDERFRRLMQKYIDAADGLALGHQTSHIYAVDFLSPIDHYIKERLHIRYYGRYMDDFYLIHESKEHLQFCLAEITRELASIGLELNDKTNILPLKNGIDFCGFHTYITQNGKVVRKLRRSSVKRIKRHMKAWAAEYRAGEVTQEKIMERFQSWEAHAKHGDTRQLREEMRKRVLKIFDTEKE